MTSENIIKSLGAENVHSGKIFLENAIAEHLSPNYFDKCPLAHVSSRTKDISKYNTFPFQDGLQKEGTHLGQPKYPEGYPAPGRDALFSSVCKYYSDNFTKDGDVLLIVSHGLVVESVLEFYNEFESKDI